jgi:hypothetical protein
VPRHADDVKRTGLLVVQLGGLTNATAIMTGFALLSIVAVVLGRETRDEQLPR